MILTNKDFEHLISENPDDLSCLNMPEWIINTDNIVSVSRPIININDNCNIYEDGEYGLNAALHLIINGVHIPIFCFDGFNDAQIKHLENNKLTKYYPDPLDVGYLYIQNVYDEICKVLKGEE